MSKRDGEECGQHDIHSSPDSKVRTKKCPVNTTSMILMIDSDWYYDIDDFRDFARNGNPFLIYTFQPEEMAGLTTDSRYSFDADNNVVMRTDSAGQFRHQVWNWDMPTLVFYYADRTVHYDVNRMNVGGQRQAVFLTCFKVSPHSRYETLFGCIPFRDSTLQRRQYVSKITAGYAVNKFVRRDAREDYDPSKYDPLDDKTAPYAKREWISIATPGECFSATIPSDLFAETRTRYGLEKNDVNVAQVAHYLKHRGLSDEEADRATGLVAMYLKATEKQFRPTECKDWCGTPADAYNVQGDMDQTYKVQDIVLAEGGKMPIRTMHAPLVTIPATVPAVSAANELAAMEYRVFRVANTAMPRPSHLYAKWAQDALDQMLSGWEGTIHPWDLHRTVESQNNKIQKPKNRKWTGFLSRHRKCVNVDAFLKAEPTDNYGAPRIISNCDKPHNLLLAMFSLAISERVKEKFKWYASGKTLEEVANRVVQMGARLNAKGGRWIVETDMSKFDGHYSEWMYNHIFKPFMLRAVHPKHRAMLEQILDLETVATARTKSGFVYLPGFGTLSGSAITTLRNTITIAVVDMMAAMSARGGKLPAKAAFENLGLDSGDDQLSTNDPLAIEEVATQLGLEIKIFVHTPTSNTFPGFLGRLFPYWNTDGPYANASIQAPERQLGKAHLTKAPTSIHIHQAMLNKGIGQAALDPMNPVTAALNDAYQRIIERERRLLKLKSLKLEITRLDDFPWWVQDNLPLDANGLPIDKPKPTRAYCQAQLWQQDVGNATASWPQVPSRTDYLRLMAEASGYPLGQLQRLITDLYNATSIHDLNNIEPLSSPQNEPPKLRVELLRSPWATLGNVSAYVKRARAQAALASTTSTGGPDLGPKTRDAAVSTDYDHVFRRHNGRSQSVPVTTARPSRAQPLATGGSTASRPSPRTKRHPHPQSLDRLYERNHRSGTVDPRNDDGGRMSLGLCNCHCDGDQVTWNQANPGSKIPPRALNFVQLVARDTVFVVAQLPASVAQGPDGQGVIPGTPVAGSNNDKPPSKSAQPGGSQPNHRSSGTNPGQRPGPGKSAKRIPKAVREKSHGLPRTAPATTASATATTTGTSATPGAAKGAPPDGTRNPGGNPGAGTGQAGGGGKSGDRQLHRYGARPGDLRPRPPQSRRPPSSTAHYPFPTRTFSSSIPRASGNVPTVPRPSTSTHPMATSGAGRPGQGHATVPGLSAPNQNAQTSTPQQPTPSTSREVAGRNDLKAQAYYRQFTQPR